MRYLLILLVMLSVQATAQTLNKTVFDPVHNKDIMINICSREGLMGSKDYLEMYNALYPSYSPDSASISAIKKYAKDIRITIVMGTWCGDSKLQVPHFYKIVDQLGIKEKNITLICVDASKKAENGLIDALNIQRVPTFIVYNKKKQELGRIIEHPTESLEKDLLKIVADKHK